MGRPIKPGIYELPEPKPEDTLTPAEIRACSLASEGLNNVEIGRQLGCSASSIAAALYRSRQKSGTDNRVQMVLWFLRKWPTEAECREAYRDACVRVVEGLSRAQRSRVLMRKLGK